MTHFKSLLNELNNKIDLPQPQKSRIILECAADLNDLYSYYLGKGLTEQEAVNKAKEKFELTDAIIADLSEIHSNLFRQWLERTIGKTQDIWERILFSLLFIFLALATIFAVITTPFLSESSVFIFPVIFVFIAILITWSIKFYQLYIKKDHIIKHLNSGMFLFKYLAIAILFIGISGYFVESYFYGIKTLFLGPLFIILTHEALELMPVVDYLIRSSSLMLICLFSILVSGLLWFFISQKINAIEQAEAEILLAE